MVENGGDIPLTLESDSSDCTLTQRTSPNNGGEYASSYMYDYKSPGFPNRYSGGVECHDRTETVRVVSGC